MARLPRLSYPGAFYHVYNRGVEKRPIVRDDQDRKTFLSIMSKSIYHYNLRLFSYCLMDNHFHLFLQTVEPNISAAMQNFQFKYAQYFNSRYDRSGALFQGRFKSPFVHVDSYALTLVRYIHWNPLAAGMVSKLEDYAWSSYNCYIGKFNQWKWLDTHFVLELFHPESAKSTDLFKLFHQIQPPENEVRIFDKMNNILK